MVPSAAFWDDLLEYIEDGRVIPVIGSELLRIPSGGSETTLHGWLALRLAERLGLASSDVPEEDGLNHVICNYLKQNGRREDIYPRIRSILKEATFPTPEPLRRLAQIPQFRLFVSTTFDTLLEQALNEERAGRDGSARVISYTPNNVKDLPGELAHLERPTVFHLLGRLSSAPDYVISEEDTLEFLYAMQTENKRPERLFDELRRNHLLLIGNHFPDWLARFFIRLIKGARLSGPRDSSEILADRFALRERNLVLFLQSFSYHTRVFMDGGAVEFVDELARRIAARRPVVPAGLEAGAAARGTAGLAAEGEPMPQGAVFLSYASQDLAAVEVMRDALESVGVEVWFDKRRLEGGDDYDQKIRRNIKACSLFVPVISAHTQAREEGYFRLEWRLAAERAMQIADSIPFVLPVVIDQTSEADALVPERFLSIQWTRLLGGRVTPEFGLHLVKLLRERRKRERSHV